MFKQIGRSAVLITFITGLLGIGLLSVAAQDEATFYVVCSQYVREAPDAQSARIAVMHPGESHTASERQGEWLRIGYEAAFSGWVYDGACITFENPWPAGIPILHAPSEAVLLIPPVQPTVLIQNEPVTPVTETAPTAATVVVRCSQYLREEARNSAAKVTIINGIEGPLHITGRNEANTWMQIALQDGTTGWAATGICLDAAGDYDAVPILPAEAPYSGPTAADIMCYANLRETPSLDGVKITVLSPDSGLFPILARDAVANWLLIEHDGGSGWVSYSACVDVLGDVLAVPVQ